MPYFIEFCKSLRFIKDSNAPTVVVYMAGKPVTTMYMEVINQAQASRENTDSGNSSNRYLYSINKNLYFR